MIVNIIGAGLAGCEAAYQLAKFKIHVKLYDVKPTSRHVAFKSNNFAELLCSNSLRSNNIENAVGLLKQELRILDSLIIKSADLNQVEAGSSLAVDRDNFSKYITDVILNNPYIEFINEEIENIDIDKYTIVCAGPLCLDKLSKNISKLIGQDYLYFYDAVSPIIEKDSIDFNYAYYKDRWNDNEKGNYINCPLTKQQYDIFYEACVNAKTIDVKEMDDEKYFEGCMPFETMAKRGYKTLLYGPMKPVGLRYNGEVPYAVVQLRKDNAVDTMYNIVGFQTHLTFSEQKKVLGLIPALKNANILRYGVMHRNTYINSPKILNNFYQLINNQKIFFAGQITGVEGYVESCASGLYASLSMLQYINENKIDFKLESNTIIGSMANYISDIHIDKLVPMNANFSLFKCNFDGNKQDKKKFYVETALKNIEQYKNNLYDKYLK